MVERALHTAPLLWHFSTARAALNKILKPWQRKAWWWSRARLPWAAKPTQSHDDEDDEVDDDGDGEDDSDDDDKDNNDDDDIDDAADPRDLIGHTAGILF